ncbi:MAG: hypothetical protein JOZ41_08515 [Chloroflexi bacterium]|nr:hypothetical protein [Chloroflexota bacterium]
MKKLLRSTRLIVLGSVLALASLTLATTAVPAAHASGSPYISVYGQGGGAQIYGWQFTEGVSARVELLDSGLTRTLAVQYITPWWNSTHAYGVFDLLLSTGYVGSAWVAVDQAGHSTVWAKTYIYSAPHISTSPITNGIQINGSGYTPGATVRIEVMDSTWTNVLSTQYTTAISSGVSAGTFFATAGGPCGTLHLMVDGSPGPTQGATFSVC